ncbi:MAG: hypothetical protein ACYC9Q_09315 [Bacillota bacterium]
MRDTSRDAVEATVEFTVKVWYDHEDQVIRITGPEGLGMNSAVSDHPASERFHPDLYAKLRKVLITYSCWPKAPPNPRGA